jgi:hypothetical protein
VDLKSQASDSGNEPCRSDFAATVHESIDDDVNPFKSKSREGSVTPSEAPTIEDGLMMDLDEGIDDPLHKEHELRISYSASSSISNMDKHQIMEDDDAPTPFLSPVLSPLDAIPTPIFGDKLHQDILSEFACHGQLKEENDSMYYLLNTLAHTQKSTVEYDMYAMMPAATGIDSEPVVPIPTLFKSGLTVASSCESITAARDSCKEQQAKRHPIEAQNQTPTCKPDHLISPNDWDFDTQSDSISLLIDKDFYGDSSFQYQTTHIPLPTRSGPYPEFMHGLNNLATPTTQDSLDKSPSGIIQKLFNVPACPDDGDSKERIPNNQHHYLLTPQPSSCSLGADPQTLLQPQYHPTKIQACSTSTSSSPLTPPFESRPFGSQKYRYPFQGYFAAYVRHSAAKKHVKTKHTSSDVVSVKKLKTGKMKRL